MGSSLPTVDCQPAAMASLGAAICRSRTPMMVVAGACLWMWGGPACAAEPADAPSGPSAPTAGTGEVREASIPPQGVARLNALEFIGSDGIVYPDFTHAGIPGGIPVVPEAAQVALTDAMREGREDISSAVQAAVAEAAARGGGAVLLPGGTFLLAKPLVIRDSGIVLRGAGRDRTRIRFDYPMGEDGFVWVTPAENDDTLRPTDMITVHYDTQRMSEVSLWVNGRKVTSLKPDASGGDRFWIQFPVWKNPGAFKPDVTNDITVRVDRFDGQNRVSKRTVLYDTQDNGRRGGVRVPSQVASIHFIGDHRLGSLDPARVRGPVARGDTRVTVLAPLPLLAAGDMVVLEAPASTAFLADIRSDRKDIPRAQAFVVAGVENDVVHFTQPVRQDFAADDAISLTRLDPIRRSGLESLTLEHARKQWVNGISFDSAQECWIKDVAVIKPGRNPAGFSRSKNCTMEDCFFDDKWFGGGGGTGYLGFGYAWDCLMDRVEARNLRHAPNFQSAASGNVVRRSNFFSSDINFHMQWAPENLIELCEIDARRGTGSYGYGVFAQTADNTMHGPGGGPRNVIWGNRISSPRAGAYFGGSNRGWIVAYNRFEVGDGPGVQQRFGSVGHQFRGNVFRLGSASSPGFLFEDDQHGDSVYRDNIVTGAGELASGPGSEAVDGGENKTLAADATAPEVDLPFPSLFEAQRAAAGSD